MGQRRNLGVVTVAAVLASGLVTLPVSAAAAAVSAAVGLTRGEPVPPPRLVSPAADQPAGPAPAPGTPSGPRSSELEAATQQARAAGVSVVVAGRTTPRSRTLANPDGSFTTESSPAPVRWRDGEGRWQDVDLSVVARTDGSVGPRSAPPAAGEVGADGTVSASSRAGTVRWRADGVLPGRVRAADSEIVAAAGLGSGRDVRWRVVPGGVKESLVVSDRTGSAEVCLTL